MNVRTAASLAAALSLVLAPAALDASTATATVTVTATVNAECTTTGGTLNFGTYSPLSAGNLDQTVQVSVTCTKGTTSTVGLNLGANASGSTRRMTNGTDFLTYELYSDSARTSVWGNSSGSWVSLSAAPSNAARTLTVYGRTTGSQDVSVGSYSDSVTVTVTY